MKNCLFVVVGLGVLMALPSLGSADCCDFGGYGGNYSIEGYNTVILYSGGTPMGRFSVQCSIQSNSKVQLIKTYMCDGDEILVDGSRCMVNNVTSTN